MLKNLPKHKPEHHPVHAEIHFRAPKGSTREQIIKALADWVDTGEMAKGFTAPKVINWNGKEKWSRKDLRDAFLGIIHSRETDIALDRKHTGSDK
jgi:hypothetical protein